MEKSRRVVFPLIIKNNFSFFINTHKCLGPAPQSIHNGKKWFINFVDDYTRVTWVYLFKHKSDVCNVFRFFHHMIITQLNTYIKVI